MNRSYVTLLCNDNVGYVKGILTLNKSLKLVGAQYPFSCICTEDVSEETCKIFAAQNIQVIRRQTGFIPEGLLNRSAAQGSPSNYLLCTAAKFLIFTLTEFDKIVYLDADTCVFQNVDDLFNWPHMSGVEDGRNLLFQFEQGDMFNAGVLVIEPSLELFSLLNEFTGKLGEREGMGWNDQSILRAYYKDWAMDASLHLPWNYNVFTSYLDKYEGNYPEFNRSDIKIAHFTMYKPFNKDVFLNECYAQYYKIMDQTDFSAIEKEIVIVTTFFDVGRGDYPEFAKRTKEDYFSYFKVWARMRNRVVCFCAPEDAEEIMDIRRGFGLEEKTDIFTIENLYEIEPKRYKKMEEIEKCPAFKYIRKNRPEGTPENFAKYNYITSLKSNFIDLAQKQAKRTNVLYAWLDFGYNHGDDLYYDPTDFDYEWKYDFDPTKITLFTVADCTSCGSILSQFLTYREWLAGGPMIVPAPLTEKFAAIMSTQYTHMLSMGMMDDDQLALSMAVNSCGGYFNLIGSYWGIQLWQCGGRHLKIKKDNKLGVKIE